MGWTMRIVMLLAAVCVASSALYFRVFSPGETAPGAIIDFSEPAPEPGKFLLSLGPEQPGMKLAEEPARPKQARVMTEPPPSNPEPVSPPKLLVLPRAAVKPVASESVSPNPPTEAFAPTRPVPEVETGPIEPVKPKPRIYVVKSGDSLWKIAKKELGRGARHEEIFKLNAEALNGNRHNLRIGQKLILPPE